MRPGSGNSFKNPLSGNPLAPSNPLSGNITGNITSGPIGGPIGGVGGPIGGGGPINMNRGGVPGGGPLNPNPNQQNNLVNQQQLQGQGPIGGPIGSGPIWGNPNQRGPGGPLVPGPVGPIGGPIGGAYNPNQPGGMQPMMNPGMQQNPNQMNPNQMPLNPNLRNPNQMPPSGGPIGMGNPNQNRPNPNQPMPGPMSMNNPNQNPNRPNPNQSPPPGPPRQQQNNPNQPNPNQPGMTNGLGPGPGPAKSNPNQPKESPTQQQHSGGKSSVTGAGGSGSKPLSNTPNSNAGTPGNQNSNKSQAQSNQQSDRGSGKVDPPPQPPTGPNTDPQLYSLVTNVVSANIIRAETKTSFLNTHTIYVIQIKDFGREYEIERRFDDFSNLHADLARVTGSDALPALPERVWGGSADPEVVRKRQPALNMLLQYCFANKEALFEKNNLLWTFLEIGLPCVFCTRCILLGFNFCSKQPIPGLGTASAKQVIYPMLGIASAKVSDAGENNESDKGKSSITSSASATSSTRSLTDEMCFFFGQMQKLIVDAKYESDRYRLEHPTMQKIVLKVLETIEIKPSDNSSTTTATVNATSKSDNSASATSQTKQNGTTSSDIMSRLSAVRLESGNSNDDFGPSNRKPTISDVVSACAEILAYILAKKDAREKFLEEKGLEKMFRILAKEVKLNPRVKKIFNVILGNTDLDRIGEMFASNLMEAHRENNQGIVNPNGKNLVDTLLTLSSPSSDSSFHEFIARFLWLIWQTNNLQNFFVEGGLTILSNLFQCQSHTARTYVALMLAVLLANHLLHDKRQTMAETCINDLITELEPIVFFGQIRAIKAAQSGASATKGGGSGQNSGSASTNQNLNNSNSNSNSGDQSSSNLNQNTASSSSNTNNDEGTSVKDSTSGKSAFAAITGAMSAIQQNLQTSDSDNMSNNLSSDYLIQDPTIKALSDDLTQLGQVQSSLLKIYGCLSDSGNVVSAKLALYVLRECQPKPEHLAKFYSLLSPWIIHDKPQGYPEPQMVAADILLEMTSQNPVLYGESGLFSDPKATLPLYLQDVNQERKLRYALKQMILYENQLMVRQYESTRSLLENQITLGSQRLNLPIPDTFMSSQLSLKQNQTALNSNEKCVFRKVDISILEYEKCREQLKEAMQDTTLSQTGLKEQLEKNAQIQGPPLLDEMSDGMEALKRMYDQCYQAFSTASDNQSRIKILQSELLTSETNQKQAEQQLVELVTEISQSQIKIQEKKSEGQRLEIVINSGQNEGEAAEAQKKIQELLKEIGELNAKVEKAESDKQECQQKVSELHQSTAYNTKEVVRLTDEYKKINVKQLEAGLGAQRAKIEPLYRRQHSEWRAVLSEIRKTQVQLSRFSSKSKLLSKALIKERMVRYKLVGATNEASTALQAFEATLQGVDDSHIQQLEEMFL